MWCNNVVVHKKVVRNQCIDNKYYRIYTIKNFKEGEVF